MCDASLLPEQEAQLAALQGEDRTGAEEIIRSFAATPDDPSRRAELWRARAAAFPLEKKALPVVSAVLRGQCEADALVATVGLTAEPVVLTLLSLRPQVAYLLHTEISREIALKVEADPEVRVAGITCLPRPVSEYDVAANYRQVEEVWADARRRLGAQVRLAVDPTGGTKMMVASLATWTFYRRVPVTYLYCPARQGVPVPFAGRLEWIGNPYQAFADIELDQVRRLADLGLYDAACSLCQSVGRTVADPALAHRLELLAEWLEIHHLWDGFAHSEPDPARRPRLDHRLRAVYAELARFGWVDPEEPQRRANSEFLEGLYAQTQDQCHNMCDLHRLADLLAQAERRRRQGRYDDAGARLYRAVEMALSIRLLEYGLGSTDRPDWDRFARWTGVSYEQAAAKARELPLPHGEKPTELAPGSLGLAGQAALLGAVDERFGREGYPWLRRELGEGGAFQRRNRSTLAHGTCPLSQEEAEGFSRKVWGVLGQVLGPKLRDELAALEEKAVHAPVPWKEDGGRGQ